MGRGRSRRRRARAPRSDRPQMGRHAPCRAAKGEPANDLDPGARSERVDPTQPTQLEGRLWAEPDREILQGLVAGLVEDPVEHDDVVLSALLPGQLLWDGIHDWIFTLSTSNRGV